MAFPARTMPACVRTRFGRPESGRHTDELSASSLRKYAYCCHDSAPDVVVLSFSLSSPFCLFFVGSRCLQEPGFTRGPLLPQTFLSLRQTGPEKTCVENHLQRTSCSSRGSSASVLCFFCPRFAKLLPAPGLELVLHSSETHETRPASGLLFRVLPLQLLLPRLLSFRSPVAGRLRLRNPLPR